MRILERLTRRITRHFGAIPTPPGTSPPTRARHLRTTKILAVIVLFVALAMAFGHMPLALFLGSLMRPASVRPPSGGRPPGAGGGSPFPFITIGAYFLIATILYVLGGILVASGKLFKLANLGLIILAVADNALLIYTRSMPNIFFQRAIPWSWGWFPLGTVQIFIGQAIIIVVCALLISKPKFLGAR
jgi:hypothetical protein